MNLPNRLTIFRMILVPVFVVFMLVNFGSVIWPYILSLVIFIVASLTDMLDGRISRKRNLVSNFGKFMDPLADKLLVCSALICLMTLDLAPAWIVIIIIAREFVISGFRLIAAEQQIVIAAGIWGKLKTVFQMAAIILLLFSCAWNPRLGPVYPIRLLGTIVLYIAAVLTVISMIVYIVQNRNVLAEQNQGGPDK